MKKLLLLPALICAFITQAQTPVKKVLMEEFTTVLCGACPPATYTLNQFHQSQPNSILVTIHEGFGRDSMSTPTTLAIWNAFKPSWGSFAPAIMVERTVYPAIDSIPYLSTFTSGYDTLVMNALQEPPIVDIQISSQYFPGIGALYSTVTSTFIDPLPPGDYRVNLFLVEDSVVGYGYPGYAQKCYDANFVAQHYPGYPYANDTISGYPHRYVFRETFSGNAFGTSQTTPVLTSGQSPAIGVPYVFTMAVPFVLPFNYNFDRLYLVASVNYYEAGSYTGNEVINAQRVKVSENIASGISSSPTLPGFGLYPNPATDQVRINFTLQQKDTYRIYFTDVSGRIVHAAPEKLFAAGGNEISIPVTHLQSGIYAVHLESDNNSVVQKLLIAD